MFFFVWLLFVSLFVYVVVSDTLNMMFVLLLCVLSYAVVFSYFMCLFVWLFLCRLFNVFSLMCLKCVVL